MLLYYTFYDQEELLDGTSLTWPQNRKRTVLIQPGQCSFVQILKACCGNHPIEGLKQWLNNNAELQTIKCQGRQQRGSSKHSTGKAMTEKTLDF